MELAGQLPTLLKIFLGELGSGKQASNKDRSQFSSLRYTSTCFNKLLRPTYYLVSLAAVFLGCQKTAVKEITYHYAVFEFREDDRISE